VAGFSVRMLANQNPQFGLMISIGARPRSGQWRSRRRGERRSRSLAVGRTGCVSGQDVWRAFCRRHALHAAPFALERGRSRLVPRLQRPVCWGAHVGWARGSRWPNALASAARGCLGAALIGCGGSGYRPIRSGRASGIATILATRPLGIYDMMGLGRARPSTSRRGRTGSADFGPLGEKQQWRRSAHAARRTAVRGRLTLMTLGRCRDARSNYSCYADAGTLHFLPGRLALSDHVFLKNFKGGVGAATDRTGHEHRRVKEHRTRSA